jgi:hypothetical protein
MIVGVCGFGYTGSGAVLDLLKEYRETSVIEEPEFYVSYIPGGIEDLEYNLVTNPRRFMGCNMAFRNFIRIIEANGFFLCQMQKLSKNQFKPLSQKYIRDLIQIEYSGYSFCEYFDSSSLRRNLIFRLWNKMLKIPDFLLRYGIITTPNTSMRYSINPDNFSELSRRYIEDLICSFGGDTNKTVILNQSFSADFPERSFKFFNNPKAIVVDRDPRDLYIMGKKYLLGDGRFMPVDKVEHFVEYYGGIRKYIDAGKETETLRIKLEDLIYKYEETKELIQQFINIREHYLPLQYYNPDISANNTQLYRRSETKSLLKDIKYIENRLSDYLFPFESYKSVNCLRKPF